MHCECQNLHQLARNRDIAAQQLAKTLGNRRTKAGAAVLPARRSIGLAKRLEQAAGAVPPVMPIPVSEIANRTIGRSVLKRSATSVSRPLSVNCCVAQNIEQALFELALRSVRMLPRFSAGPIE